MCSFIGWKGIHPLVWRLLLLRILYLTQRKVVNRGLLAEVGEVPTLQVEPGRRLLFSAAEPTKPIIEGLLSREARQLLVLGVDGGLCAGLAIVTEHTNDYNSNWLAIDRQHALLN